MKRFERSPTPWEVREKDGRFEVWAGPMFPVCRITSRRNAMGDAHMIASSPRMLDFLWIMDGLLDSLVNGKTSDPGWANLLDQLRLLMKKAKGESDA